MQQQIQHQHSATTTNISKDLTASFISKMSESPAKTHTEIQESVSLINPGI